MKVNLTSGCNNLGKARVIEILAFHPKTPLSSFQEPAVETRWLTY